MYSLFLFSPLLLLVSIDGSLAASCNYHDSLAEGYCNYIYGSGTIISQKFECDDTSSGKHYVYVGNDDCSGNATSTTVLDSSSTTTLFSCDAGDDCDIFTLEVSQYSGNEECSGDALESTEYTLFYYLVSEIECSEDVSTSSSMAANGTIENEFYDSDYYTQVITESGGRVTITYNSSDCNSDYVLYNDTSEQNNCVAGSNTSYGYVYSKLDVDGASDSKSVWFTSTLVVLCGCHALAALW